ncbi:MAG: JDVT-CTERM system CAAX-type protease [Nevskia sp.]|nr:JDVT-CTERM system CAAX-type protease [Nevskia sp.]
MNGALPAHPLLAALLAAALLEEIVFRGGVQEALLRLADAHGALRGRARWPAAANLSTALLFALAHGIVRSWALAAAVLPAALALGWLYQRTRRLWPCIAAHAAMNALWLLALPWLGALPARL